MRETWPAPAKTPAGTAAASTTTIGADDQDRTAYLHRRLENVELLYRWKDAIDPNLSPDPTPDALALYLALGWSQATTTYEWPDSDRWRAQFSGDAPAHWLPRAHWHLCWLVHDPADATHRAALSAALAEGLDDPERPGIAAAMQEIFPPTGW